MHCLNAWYLFASWKMQPNIVCNGQVYVTGGNYFYLSLTLCPIPSMSKLMNLLK